MCSGHRHIRLVLDADQIDAYNRFLERVKQYDCYELEGSKEIDTRPATGRIYRWKFVARPMREMASYWQGVFGMALERSESYSTSTLKGDRK